MHIHLIWNHGPSIFIQSFIFLSREWLDGIEFIPTY